jgi:UbiD family decarboxylase
MTHYKDLRSYLTALQAIGELQAIAHPVELDLEIGAISRRAGETGQAAPLFENIRGKDGFRVLGASVESHRSLDNGSRGSRWRWGFRRPRADATSSKPLRQREESR